MEVMDVIRSSSRAFPSRAVKLTLYDNDDNRICGKHFIEEGRNSLCKTEDGILVVQSTNSESLSTEYNPERLITLAVLTAQFVIFNGEHLFILELASIHSFISVSRGSKTSIVLRPKIDSTTVCCLAPGDTIRFSDCNTSIMLSIEPTVQVSSSEPTEELMAVDTPVKIESFTAILNPVSLSVEVQQSLDVTLRGTPNLSIQDKVAETPSILRQILNENHEQPSPSIAQQELPVEIPQSLSSPSRNSIRPQFDITVSEDKQDENAIEDHIQTHGDVQLVDTERIRGDEDDTDGTQSEKELGRNIPELDPFKLNSQSHRPSFMPIALEGKSSRKRPSDESSVVLAAKKLRRGPKKLLLGHSSDNVCPDSEELESLSPNQRREEASYKVSTLDEDDPDLAARPHKKRGRPKKVSVELAHVDSPKPNTSHSVIIEKKSAKKTATPKSTARSYASNDSPAPSSFDGQKLTVVFSSSNFTKLPQMLKNFKSVANVTNTAVDKKTDILCIAGGLKKTSKLLSAVALGKRVVSDDWATQCAKQKKLLDLGDYLAQDKDREEEWQIPSTWSAGGEPRTKLLNGYTFYITPSLKKEYGDGYKDIVALAKLVGAKKIISTPSRDVGDAENTIFLGLARGDLDAVALHEKKKQVYEKDFLPISILRGELCLDDFEILPEEGLPNMKKRVTKGAQGGRKSTG